MKNDLRKQIYLQKLIEKEFVIGFAGHFSAGKSSMINALTGEIYCHQSNPDEC